MHKNLALLALAILVTGCTYNQKQFVPVKSTAEMREDSRRIQDAERAERKERRNEYGEILDMEAEAYRKANSGTNVYILH
jgi:hypothetical protein